MAGSHSRVITMSLLLRITLLLFALSQLLSPCEAFGSYAGKGQNTVGKPYQDPLFWSKGGSPVGVPEETPARRGLGISAWGIVVVILALILGGMGFYYFSICYPILCKKERKYDMIQLDTV